MKREFVACDFCDVNVKVEAFVRHMFENHPQYALICGRCDKEYFPLEGHECWLPEGEAKKFLREALESLDR